MATPIRSVALAGRTLLIIVAVSTGQELARAQPGPAPARRPSFESLEALNAEYGRQLDALERRHIDDLAALAARKPGAEADAAYRELFSRALDRGLVAAALPAADRCLAAANAPTDVLGLATVVKVAVRADDAGADSPLEPLRTFLRRERARDADDPSARDTVILGVGETLLQRLIGAKHYRLGARACALLVDETGSAAAKRHFQERLQALKLVGTPAPPLRGTDVEGQPFRADALQGNVVLVHFWATWCPASVAALAHLNALAAKYENEGLALVGVNLDAHHEDVPDARAVLPAVRHTLVEHGVVWPNLLSDDGPQDVARRFGVATLPENVLIGRDGTVVGLSLDEHTLEPAVVEALARPGP